MGAIGLGSAVIAAAIGLPLYFAVFAGDGGGPAVSPTPEAEPSPAVSACALPTLIEPPAAIPSDDWQDLALPPVDDCFSIVASDADAGGVTLDSAFVLEAREPVDIASLADRLQVVPDLELDIEPVSDSEVSVHPAVLPAAAARYRIQPRVPLSEDTVYRFTILDKPDGLPIRTWAFQAQRPLRVVQTLPADQSTEVQLNIGIELTFSHEGVTGVEESFQIDPPVQGRFQTHKRTAVFVPNELSPSTPPDMDGVLPSHIIDNGLDMRHDYYGHRFITCNCHGETEKVATGGIHTGSHVLQASGHPPEGTGRRGLDSRGGGGPSS